MAAFAATEMARTANKSNIFLILRIFFWLFLIDFFQTVRVWKIHEQEYCVLWKHKTQMIRTHDVPLQKVKTFSLLKFELIMFIWLFVVLLLRLRCGGPALLRRPCTSVAPVRHRASLRGVAFFEKEPITSKRDRFFVDSVLSHDTRPYKIQRKFILLSRFPAGLLLFAKSPK